MVSSIGAGISMFAALYFVFIVFYTLKYGKDCPNNPWGEGADTLEWTLTSPPPFHTFETPPYIEG
ncbi:MAG: cytochrome c oxidase subunit I, partial [Rickettsia conorii subsp. raoultii]